MLAILNKSSKYSVKFLGLMLPAILFFNFSWAQELNKSNPSATAPNSARDSLSGYTVSLNNLELVNRTQWQSHLECYKASANLLKEIKNTAGPQLFELPGSDSLFGLASSRGNISYKTKIYVFNKDQIVLSFAKNPADKVEGNYLGQITLPISVQSKSSPTKNYCIRMKNQMITDTILNMKSNGTVAKCNPENSNYPVAQFIPPKESLTLTDAKVFEDAMMILRDSIDRNLGHIKTDLKSVTLKESGLKLQAIVNTACDPTMLSKK